MALTEEELEFRKNKLGASDAPIILGVSPWCTPLQLYKEKLGLEKRESNFQMNRGNTLEPIARKFFEDEIGVSVNPKLMMHPKYNWMIANMDGISEIGHVAVEIKCPGKKDHKTAVEGNVPEKYIPQLQHQMEVCGLDWMYYCSFDGKDIVNIKVKRDQDYIDTLISVELKFWHCLQTFDPPIM